MRALIATLLLLSACGTSGNNCVCAEIYAPVCGDDGETYGNACLAECDGVGHTPGECDTGS